MEAALERAGGDTAVEIDAAFVLTGFLRGDDQRVFPDFDGEVFVGEAGDGDRDAPCVFGGLLDVVGGVGRRGSGAIGENPVHQVGDLIEADGGTVKRCKIERTHGVILH